MKPMIPLICCSLLFIGCSESASTQPPVAPENEPQSITAAVEENSTQPAIKSPVPAEANTVAPIAQKGAEPVKTASVKGAEKAPMPPAVDGGALFGQKCSSCHGAKGEKSALNKSQVIAGWQETQVKDALKGYQTGTYGKEMKALMQGQAKGLNDTQIDALAKHIQGL